MSAPWPKAFDADFMAHYGLDESDEQIINARCELVSAGRNLRRQANLPSGKKVRYVYKPSGALTAQDADVLKLLLNAEELSVIPDFVPQKGTPVALSPLGELFLPLEGLIDVEAERARLSKDLAKIDAEIDKVRTKLANPAFVEKVPPSVLEEHQKRLVEWESKKAQTTQSLEALT